MIIEKGLVFLALLFFSFQSANIKAQDLNTPKCFIKELASSKMQGRGYVKGGDKKAADYIKNQLVGFRVGKIGNSYYQDFSFPMNTFPGKMHIELDGDTLMPVSEFVVAPECKSTKGTFGLHYLPEAADSIDVIYDSIVKVDYKGSFVVAEFPNRSIRQDKPFNAAGIVIPNKSVFWWASTGHRVTNVPVIMIKDSLMNKKPKNVTLDFRNKFITKHKTQNVMGFIEGSEQPDSFIVFSAHYDHLGWMGKGNVFYGANDNASGTAMVLWLADYFSKPENKPTCSIAFLFFAAEESGLIGSSYFVENPLLPLNQIKALINLDMVGTGSDGIAIVNGKINTGITKRIQDINTNDALFSNIKIRGESCNSDHCFFHKAGVPAVFIYTQGKEFTEYHNLNDVHKKLPLTKFRELRELLIEFAKTY